MKNIAVPFPKEKRKLLSNEIILEVSEIFSEWVLEGDIYDVSYENDPPWDHSGTVIKRDSNEERRLSAYSTLGAWMNDCLTGNSTPSFESGYGMYHDFFEQEVSSHVQNLIEHKLIESRGLDPKADDSIEEVCDEAIDILCEIMESVEAYSTELAFEIGEKAARRDIQAREAEAEQRRQQGKRQCEIVKSFCACNFSDYKDVRIDMPHARLFLAHCLEVFSKANQEELEAVLAVGISGDFSNRVSEEIGGLARKALNKIRCIESGGFGG
jgi:hypothetical protein